MPGSGQRVRRPCRWYRLLDNGDFVGVYGGRLEGVESQRKRVSSFASDPRRHAKLKVPLSMSFLHG